MERGIQEIRTPQGKFTGNVRITSAGVFGLENGNTVHFLFIEKQDGKDKGKWELGVEIYDNELSYRGFYTVRTFDNVKTKFEPVIKAKDSNDNFYMISQEGYPVIRKFSLDIEYK